MRSGHVCKKRPIDFIAYDTDGKVLLLAETKSRRGTSKGWAAEFRRNMLAHDVLPSAKYFLIAIPDRMYGWEQNNLSVGEVPQQFTIDARKVLAPYFKRLNLNSETISPSAFELLIHTWLTDIARSAEYRAELDASHESMSESSLFSSLEHAQIEMNAAR
jgi:hypothetical protein